jgi:hypothetical protein
MNSIPQPQAPLIQLSVKARAAAEAIGPEIDLQHNKGTDIAADLHDVTGDPANPSEPGKQAQYNTSKESLKAARAAARQATQAGQEFCRQGIALLKSVLGTSYGSAWNAAGFLARSLQVPRHPVPMLLEFRQYFERHAAHENAPLNLTAVQAQATLTAIQAADLAVASAKAASVRAKKLRDEAVRNLYRRMSNLRKELEQVLEDDDGRWYEFGFHRPIDGRIPEPVSEIAVTPLAPGVASVAWDPSTRAQNYRVKWFVDDGDDSPITEVGLFTDRQCTLTGLPARSTIVVTITSRNAAGEASPTEVRIVLH